MDIDDGEGDLSWAQEENYREDDDDDDMITEDTAMLCAAATTEIVITPISPVNSTHDLSLIDHAEGTTVVDLHTMDLLKPEARVLSDEG